MAGAVVVAVALCVFVASGAADETVPKVETGPFRTIGPRGGYYIGKIDPQGHFVNYWLAFGRNRPSEHHTWISEEQPYRYGGPTNVYGLVENLREGTVYHYRLVGVYDNRTKFVYGQEMSFRTKCWKKESDTEIVVPCLR